MLAEERDEALQKAESALAKEKMLAEEQVTLKQKLQDALSANSTLTQDLFDEQLTAAGLESALEDGRWTADGLNQLLEGERLKVAELERGLEGERLKVAELERELGDEKQTVERLEHQIANPGVGGGNPGLLQQQLDALQRELDDTKIRLEVAEWDRALATLPRGGPSISINVNGRSMGVSDQSHEHIKFTFEVWRKRFIAWVIQNENLPWVFPTGQVTITADDMKNALRTMAVPYGLRANQEVDVKTVYTAIQNADKKKVLEDLWKHSRTALNRLK